MPLPLQVVALPLDPLLVLDEAMIVRKKVVVVVEQVGHPVGKDVHGIVLIFLHRGHLDDFGMEKLPPG